MAHLDENSFFLPAHEVPMLMHMPVDRESKAGDITLLDTEIYLAVCAGSII
jgi:hypothetical protein